MAVARTRSLGATRPHPCAALAARTRRQYKDDSATPAELYWAGAHKRCGTGYQFGSEVAPRCCPEVVLRDRSRH
jgi:hypothetical protein